MDTRGAVDLSAVNLAVVEVPKAAGRRFGAGLWADAPGTRDAMKWLFAASVLQALVVHTRSERGLRFGLDTRASMSSPSPSSPRSC